jgi:hypothetical protein
MIKRMSLSPGALVRLGCRTLLAGVLCLACAEFTARGEDRLFDGVPLLANPTPESALVFRDGSGVTRGRPGGRYGQWRLNAWGFRGPEIARVAESGTTRVMVLGSSETFGLYEPSGQEFPRQFETRLRQAGRRVEVVNAGLFGMTLRSMLPYYRVWASTFRPDVVVIYPSPLFYLQDAILSRRGPNATAAPAPRPQPVPPAQNAFRSRFIGRLRDALDQPEFFVRWNDRRQIAALTANRPASWFFDGVPGDRVQLFGDDLRGLVEEVQASGARVVLVTHAFRCATPPTADDLVLLDRTRAFSPRATAATIHAFHGATNDEIAEIGRERSVPVIDADAVLSGHPEFFGDLIHFTDAGAAAMGEQLASGIAAVLTRRDGDRPARSSEHVQRDAVQ